MLIPLSRCVALTPECISVELAASACRGLLEEDPDLPVFSEYFVRSLATCRCLVPSLSRMSCSYLAIDNFPPFFVGLIQVQSTMHFPTHSCLPLRPIMPLDDLSFILVIVLLSSSHTTHSHFGPVYYLSCTCFGNGLPWHRHFLVCRLVLAGFVLHTIALYHITPIRMYF